jgi:hypothetical protein
MTSPSDDTKARLVALEIRMEEAASVVADLPQLFHDMVHLMAQTTRRDGTVLVPQEDYEFCCVDAIDDEQGYRFHLAMTGVGSGDGLTITIHRQRIPVTEVDA